MTSFGNGVIAEVISYLRVRSLGWALIQYDCSLIKRGHLDTDMHTSCENEGGDQGDASTSQRTPEIVSKPPDAGVRGGGRGLADSPSQTPEGTNPADTLSLAFWPPEARGNKCLLFYASDLWFFVSGHRKLIHRVTLPSAAQEGPRSAVDSPDSKGPMMLYITDRAVL